MKVNPHRSSLGMDANTLALLSYVAAFVLSWVPIIKYVAWAAPLVLFFVEKQSPFVKFHAMQAFLLEVVSWVITIVFSVLLFWMPFNGLLAAILNVLLTILAIVALVKAGGYEEYKIPVIGDIADKIRRSNMPI
ncbi:Uncharacterized membrane protein [Sporobacter termitidis DSM 10068]|uniref:Uncharacterized membrane protein n=1 Tax=Sporobacter termitidis DSM 10068 TaxID=1123282 RepID=A0A1M5UFC8_9FIRM|nr:DUF4870 domain-containing protein [Sporobacter termitidis]SHH61657.1 Uncharacterized membrane protein [Sporobacter termitidis DSM 10068]